MIVKFGDSCLSTASQSKQDANKLFIYVFKDALVDQTVVEAVKALMEGCDQLSEETSVYIDAAFYFVLKEKIVLIGKKELKKEILIEEITKSKKEIEIKVGIIIIIIIMIEENRLSHCIILMV